MRRKEKTQDYKNYSTEAIERQNKTHSRVKHLILNE